MTKRAALKAIAAATIFALTGIAHAQQTVKIANIVELSGPGTTAGTLFKNGVELAVKEINGAGGILGKKIESYTVDTQTNPGVAKGLTQKAVDDGVDMSAAVKSFNAAPFMRLLNAAELMPGNASRTYLELERE